MKPNEMRNLLQQKKNAVVNTVESEELATQKENNKKKSFYRN